MSLTPHELRLLDQLVEARERQARAAGGADRRAQALSLGALLDRRRRSLGGQPD